MSDNPLEQAVLVTLVFILVGRIQKWHDVGPWTADRLVSIFACFYGLFLTRSLAGLTLNHYGVSGAWWNWFILAGILALWIPLFRLALRR